MSDGLTASQVEDLAGFIDTLTNLCSEYGFRPFSYGDLDLARLDSSVALGPTLTWGGNDDDGYEFSLVLA